MGCCRSRAKKGKIDTAVLQARKVKYEVVDRKKQITHNSGKLYELYDLEKEKLGEGASGTVYLATQRLYREVRAVKVVAKDQRNGGEQAKREMEILKMLAHPNIIKLYETFEDYRNVYLVLELCTGGELLDRVLELGHFTEIQAAIVLQQIFLVVHYMHENDVCHRDCKPENFLFSTKEPIERTSLKVIDFGHSCRFGEGTEMKTRVGASFYVAPEVLSGKYNEACDLWSCGVMMFVLLSGYPPFDGRTDDEVLNEVRKGKVAFNEDDWRFVSEDAKDLIRKLLVLDPKARLTAEQCVKHSWIKNKAPEATGASLTPIMGALRGFRSENKLKRAALYVIASQLGEAQIQGLRNVFKRLDTDGDGKLSMKELSKGLRQSGWQNVPLELEQVMQEVDSDGSGLIDYSEFLAATLDRKLALQEETCWRAFRVFDLDGDGKITAKELEQVLGSDHLADVTKFGGHLVLGNSVQELIKEVDVNRDGVIDFSEFMVMMRSKSRAIEQALFKSSNAGMLQSPSKPGTNVPLALCSPSMRGGARLPDGGITPVIAETITYVTGIVPVLLAPDEILLPEGETMLRGPSFTMSGLNCDSVNTIDEWGCSALTAAADKGLSDVCLALLNRADFNQVNATDPWGRTALFAAASMGLHEVCLSILARADFHEVNTKTKNGSTAFIVAADRCLTEVCLSLMEHPKFNEVTAVDQSGRTALTTADSRGLVKVSAAIRLSPLMRFCRRRLKLYFRELHTRARASTLALGATLPPVPPKAGATPAASKGTPAASKAEASGTPAASKGTPAASKGTPAAPNASAGAKALPATLPQVHTVTGYASSLIARASLLMPSSPSAKVASSPSAKVVPLATAHTQTTNILNSKVTPT